MAPGVADAAGVGGGGAIRSSAPVSDRWRPRLRPSKNPIGFRSRFAPGSIAWSAWSSDAWTRTPTGHSRVRSFGASRDISESADYLRPRTTDGDSVMIRAQSASSVLVTCVLSLVALPMSFLLYCNVRIMRECVGFDLQNSLILAFAVVITIGTCIVMPITSLTWFGSVFRRHRHESPARFARLLTLSVSVSAVIGAAIGEGWMLRDEYLFKNEILIHHFEHDEDIYTRPRTWPVRSSLLMYSKSKGLWTIE